MQEGSTGEEKRKGTEECDYGFAEQNRKSDDRTGKSGGWKRVA